MSRVIFGRIGGRIIPIMDKNPAIAGAAIVGTAGVAATRLRRKVAEATQGKGKTSFGTVGNIAFDFGVSAAAVGALASKAPRVHNYLGAFGSLLRRSFTGRG